MLALTNKEVNRLLILVFYTKESAVVKLSKASVDTRMRTMMKMTTTTTTVTAAVIIKDASAPLSVAVPHTPCIDKDYNCGL
jgi:hypothetical protein